MVCARKWVERRIRGRNKSFLKGRRRRVEEGAELGIYWVGGSNARKWGEITQEDLHEMFGGKAGVALGKNL